jgi:hypothetical protein
VVVATDNTDLNSIDASFTWGLTTRIQTVIDRTEFAWNSSVIYQVRLAAIALHWVAIN